jgi:hypothetical protein
MGRYAGRKQKLRLHTFTADFPDKIIEGIQGGLNQQCIPLLFGPGARRKKQDGNNQPQYNVYISHGSLFC